MGRVHLEQQSRLEAIHFTSIPESTEFMRKTGKKRYNETPKKSEARQIYEPEPTFDPLCHIYQESWHQKKKDVNCLRLKLREPPSVDVTFTAGEAESLHAPAKRKERRIRGFLPEGWVWSGSGI